MAGRAKDIGCAAVAIVMALNVAAAAVVLVWGVATGEWDRVARGAVSVVFSSWVGLGAWLRTRWGRAPA